MKEVVKLDILGERRVVFDDVGIMYCATDKYSPIPTIAGIALSLLFDTPIPYDKIRWVGRVRKRQWWALIVGLLFTLFCLAGLCGERRDAGVIITCMVIFALLGALPLWMFYCGRPFLVVRADNGGICLPMDRNKKAMRQILKHLIVRCQGLDVKWDL